MFCVCGSDVSFLGVSGSSSFNFVASERLSLKYKLFKVLRTLSSDASVVAFKARHRQICRTQNDGKTNMSQARSSDFYKCNA